MGPVTESWVSSFRPLSHFTCALQCLPKEAPVAAPVSDTAMPRSPHTPEQSWDVLPTCCICSNVLPSLCVASATFYGSPQTFGRECLFSLELSRRTKCSVLHKVADQLSLTHALVRLSTVLCMTTSSSEELCVLVVKFIHSLSTLLLNAFKASGSVLGPGRSEFQGIIIVFLKNSSLAVVPGGLEWLD